jgi:hypothetical protein
MGAEMYIPCQQKRRKYVDHVLADQCPILTGAYLRKARLNGANLAGADLRSADLSDADFERFESIAEADFTNVQGLSDDMQSRLLGHLKQELDTINQLTLKTTKDSLN